MMTFSCKCTLHHRPDREREEVLVMVIALAVGLDNSRERHHVFDIFA
jgi:hypothetical protein